MKRRDEVSVGILIAVATAVLILGTLWLVRGGLKPGYPLYTRFAWGQNLKQGQPVLLAGVTVGYVGDVTLRPEGYLDVLLKLDDKYNVPKGSKATVKAIGIFGDVAVALNPPIPPPRDSYSPGDTVPAGTPSADIDQIMSSVDSITRAANAMLKSINQQVIEAGTLRDLQKTIASASALSLQIQRTVTEQSRELSQTQAAVRQSLAHLNSLADSAKIDAIVQNLRVASDNGKRLVSNFDSTNTRLQALIAKAESPNGTIGKFLTDSLLYTDFRRLLTTSDSLIADIKANPRKYINLSIFGGK
jgi:phospholipid/cholesterol/gamma-HCH transport system substrate-binding protein